MNVTALAVGTLQTSKQAFTVSCSPPGEKTISLQYGIALANAADNDPDVTSNSRSASFQID